MIDEKFSDVILNMMQKTSNVANQLTSLIVVSVLSSCWQDHTDSPTNSKSWSYFCDVINFRTWSENSTFIM